MIFYVPVTLTTTPSPDLHTGAEHWCFWKSLSVTHLTVPHESTEIHRSILQLGVWDAEAEGFGCSLEVHREAIIHCILLTVSILTNNENHLPAGKLFVPEQIIITVSGVIHAVQGHSLCLLHRHFWLRLSDGLDHNGSCGKEERPALGCHRQIKQPAS